MAERQEPYLYTNQDPPGAHQFYVNHLHERQLFYECSSLSVTVTTNPQQVQLPDSLGARVKLWLKELVADGVTVDGVSKQATDQVWFVVIEPPQGNFTRTYVQKTLSSVLNKGVPVTVKVLDGSTRVHLTFQNMPLVNNFDRSVGVIDDQFSLTVYNEAGALATFSKLSIVMEVTKKI